MERLILGLVAAVVGATVVGPVLSHAVVSWLGWQGVLPLLLGWTPPRDTVRHARAQCRACQRPLMPFVKATDRESDGDTVPGGDGDASEPPAQPLSGGALVPTAVSSPPQVAGRPGLPALPWLLVGGRCCHCRERVGRWALGVEMATGLGFAVVAARLGWSALLPAVLVLTAGLVAMSAVDLVCSRIPTRFAYLTGLGVVAAVTIGALVEGEPSSMVGAVVGGGAYLILLGLLYVLGGGGLGFGDVRLGTVVGLVVGWAGWDPAHRISGPLGTALLGLLTASLAASVVGIVLLARRRRSQLYPFGPWLSLGALVAILTVGGTWPQ